jgi:hypothetical protein
MVSYFDFGRATPSRFRGKRGVVIYISCHVVSTTELGNYSLTIESNGHIIHAFVRCGPSSRGGRQAERGAALRSGAAGRAEIGKPEIGRWSAGRRRPLRHWGRASRVAGPAGHARAARAGAFAKDLPREPRKLPRGLANPWRLPALHHPASRERKKGKRRARAAKNRAGEALARAQPSPERGGTDRRREAMAILGGVPLTLIATSIARFACCASAGPPPDALRASTSPFQGKVKRATEN